MENIALKFLHVGLMIWGRRWYVLFTALGVCIIGWTAVFMIPSRYQASTRIYVDTDTLLAPLLRGELPPVEDDQLGLLFLTCHPSLAAEAGFVPLPEAASQLALKHFQEGRVGSVFGGVPEVGVTIEELLERKAVL